MKYYLAAAVAVAIILLIFGCQKSAEIRQMPSIGAFWFSWVAQHPGTELWKESPFKL